MQKQSIFRIRKDEAVPTVVSLLLFLALNILMVVHRFSLFTKAGHVGYYTIFKKHFEVSGFDPSAYLTLSKGGIFFALNRHPFLTMLLYPLYGLNQLLISLTGKNCAVFLMAALTLFCAVYSFVFLLRIFRQVVGLRQSDAVLLTFFAFSMAFMMLSTMTPDHFGLSLFFLTMVLWLFGRELTGQGHVASWMTGLLVFFTAGVTLTNGVKPLLASWMARGRRFWSPRHLVLAVVLPCLLLLGAAWAQYEIIAVPQARQGEKMRQIAEKKNKNLAKNLAAFHKKIDQKNGQPWTDNPWFAYTNKDMARGPVVVENFFGESIQLHSRYLLHDINNDRPVVVGYSYVVNYVVEALVVLLFVLGIWAGRHERFLWLAMGWFGIDVFLHLVMGFALSEVYIMGAHWLPMVVIAVGYGFKKWRIGWPQVVSRCTVAVLTLWLWGWNAGHVAMFMLG